MIKVSLISLGCAKNLVDSEIMVGHLHQAGMQVIPEAEKADVVIVNTCSFIDASKHEALEAIYEMSDGKATARKKNQKLIVAGCMAQRYQGALPVVEGAKGQVEPHGMIVNSGDIAAFKEMAQAKVWPLYKDQYKEIWQKLAGPG